MKRPATPGDEVLEANQALREWASGLRQWSRSTRLVSDVARRRAQALRVDHAALRPAAHREGAGVDLPGLGDVRTGELGALLMRRHGLTPAQAQSALAVGMSAAGYPSGHPVVSAADAFDVLDHAVHYFC